MTDAVTAASRLRPSDPGPAPTPASEAGRSGEGRGQWHLSPQRPLRQLDALGVEGGVGQRMTGHVDAPFAGHGVTDLTREEQAAGRDELRVPAA